MEASTPILLSTRQMCDRLPPKTAVLIFQVLDETTLAWVVRKSGVNGLILDRGAADWQRYLAPIGQSGGYPDLADGLLAEGKLYEILIAPFERDLAGISRIAIAPDGPLWDVPFQALRRNAKSPALGERVTLTLTPSASVYLGGSARPVRRATTDALVLGDPAFGADSAHLPRLEGARTEAEDVANLYGVEPLLGRAATRNAFLQKAPEARVLYVAAHAEINSAHPWLSSLVLAPSGSGASGRIYAHEILDLDLGATELVVLSACRTAAGEAAPGEGVSALVHAFLAAGVPRVVASRRVVEDSSSSYLAAISSSGLLPPGFGRRWPSRSSSGFLSFGYLRSTE